MYFCRAAYWTHDHWSNIVNRNNKSKRQEFLQGILSHPPKKFIEAMFQHKSTCILKEAYKTKIIVVMYFNKKHSMA